MEAETSILSFGNSIRWRRESKRIGLRALARSTALSPSYLSRIERGRVPPPSAEVVTRLARALGADAGDLLADAGFLPENVLAFLRRRTAVAARVLTLLARMTDDEIDDLCHSLRSAAGSPIAAPRRLA